jgi:dTDP-4-dehydrorhamnose 3,5-epimerase
VSTVIDGPLPGIRFFVSNVHRDERGISLETWSAGDGGPRFVAEYLSVSHKHALRGLHYQIKRPQGKLVRVLHGAICDVVVELLTRRSTCITLRAGEAPHAVWIPPGYAHGFLALEESTTVLYKLTAPRVPAWERVIPWNDPDLAIRWPLPVGVDPILSARDRGGA